VLVVDDNKTNVAILNDQLRHWGMSVDVADSGHTALVRLRQAVREGRRHDLALIDYCMPEMNGLELARRMAEEPAITGATIVLMTSGPDVSTAEAREASVAVALTKPVLVSRLRDTLSRVVADRVPPPPSTTHRERVSLGRVLVVDDSELNRLVAVGILELLGYTPMAVDGGQQALSALADGSFDAVLMDVQMPGMDGYQTTGELRRLQGDRRHTPVIAMTATATDGERERCIAAGMDDYLSKPITRASVSVAMERWVVQGAASPS
jgi:CheY-like chemotaxis protein